MPKLSKVTGVPVTSTKETRGKTVWKGPVEEGVTFSLLSRFLVCRERFRLYVVEGLAPTPRWEKGIGYGSMWHCCEEAYGTPDSGSECQLWEVELTRHTQEQCRLFPMQQEEIEHWYQVCKVAFPIYIDYWQQMGGNEGRTPLLREQVFQVPYTLPSGRVVRLKGKWDGINVVENGGVSVIELQENKTKGEVDPEAIVRQLRWDLQTMMYVVAIHLGPNGSLTKDINPYGLTEPAPFGGVLYNVVRRPLSGGKGNIRRHQPSKSNPRGESRQEFYKRLQGLIEAEPQDYFFRWNVEITEEDVTRFRRECLDPILEQLSDWWEDILLCPSGEAALGSWRHWQTPFGVWNPLLEGRETDLDSYLATGQTTGLQRVSTVFPELT